MSSEATQTVKTVGAYDVLAWLETNKTTLLVAFIAAVVIGFGIAIYRYNADSRELEASDALLQLKTSLTSDTTNAVPPAEYLKVASQYPGTAAADRALLLAAGALFTEGKYAEARTEFARFQRDRPRSPFAATAAYGVAACLESEGNLQQALTEYQNLSVRFPNSSVLDDAKLATARIYVAQNKPDQALRIYDELSKPTGLSPANPEAVRWKQELLASHPELAQTNAPGASASTTVVPPAKAQPPAQANPTPSATGLSMTAPASTTKAPPARANPAPKAAAPPATNGAAPAK